MTRNDLVRELASVAGNIRKPMDIILVNNASLVANYVDTNLPDIEFVCNDTVVGLSSSVRFLDLPIAFEELHPVYWLSFGKNLNVYSVRYAELLCIFLATFDKRYEPYVKWLVHAFRYDDDLECIYETLFDLNLSSLVSKEAKFFIEMCYGTKPVL